MHLEQSSTMVKKKLQPLMVGVEKGPHKSQWIKSKQWLEVWELEVKGNLFCLAKGQISQSSILLTLKIGTSLCFNNANLAFDKCPNLKCQTCG